MSRSDLQVNFRIPAELKARLEAAAKENRRSITAELVHRLEVTFSGGIESKPEEDSPDIGTELTVELRKEDLAGELHMHDKNGEVRVITGDELHAALDKVLESVLGHQGGPARQTKGPRQRRKYPRQ